MALPGTIGAFINVKEGTFWDGFFKLFEYNNWFYGVLLFVLIIAFNYFNVAIQYNPVQIANDLRKNNGGVPGIRPGKPTSDFIAKVVSKITLLGGLFLGVMAVLPIIVGALTGINIALGGTTVMILVGVALDTVRELESQMMMRHYKGFLE
jgi:preprotein translocase subunit SecY